MSKIGISRELIITDEELSRPRMAVEKERLNAQFPNFKFYGRSGAITSIKGFLNTNWKTKYNIKIDVPDGYPFSIPTIWIIGGVDSSCPHKYTNDSICVMRSDEWKSFLTLAFMVARTAIWLNKYESWKESGRWPGRDQHRDYE